MGTDQATSPVPAGDSSRQSWRLLSVTIPRASSPMLQSPPGESKMPLKEPSSGRSGRLEQVLAPASASRHSPPQNSCLAWALLAVLISGRLFLTSCSRTFPLSPTGLPVIRGKGLSPPAHSAEPLHTVGAPIPRKERKTSQGRAQPCSSRRLPAPWSPASCLQPCVLQVGLGSAPSAC